MKTIKFKISRDIPSDEFISRNKPKFDDLLSQMSPGKPNISIKQWMYGGGIALATVTTIAVYSVFFMSEPESKIQSQTELNKNVSGINPPVPDAAVVPDTFRFDNESGGIFVTPKGTKISIPAKTFGDTNQNAFEGPVDLTFREFHNPIEIYRSGIPMTYDSAGTEKTFESAGMFELLAYRDGEKIEIIPGKTIRVDLASRDGRDIFNDYRYNPTAQNWEYIGRSENDPLEEKNNENEDFTIAYAGNPSDNKSQPELIEHFCKPRQADQDAYIFKVKYNAEDFPEISIYQNVLFQVDESKQKFDPDLYKVNWQKTELKNSKIAGYYILKLHRPDTSVRLYVKPVFKSSDYQVAMQTYQSTLEKNNNEMKKLESRQQTAISERKQAKKNQNEMNIRSIRVVVIPVTGVYNCDRPYIAPSEDYQPSFFISGRQIVPQTINWRIPGVNALFTARGDVKSIRIEKGISILMWVQLQNGEICIIDPATFATATLKNKKPSFELVAESPHDAIKKLQEMN